MRVENSGESRYFLHMSKESAVLSYRDAHYKALAEQYLAEAKKILKDLAAERKKEARRKKPQTNILEEVKSILAGR